MDEYENSYDYNMETPVSFKEWVLTFLILWLPVVNIIMPFIWAFSSSTPPSKRNYFRAWLIVLGVAVIFSALMFVLLFMLGAVTNMSAYQ